MSLPPINPVKSTSGIVVDAATQQRVVPPTRRSDGSVRKELKIRQGFTPQEDVSRFRGSRQQQMDANALPKGHILGWGGPTGANRKTTPTATDNTGKPLTKSQKKNEKRREKKREEATQVIKDNWEVDDDDPPQVRPAEKSSSTQKTAGTEEVDQLANQLKDSVNVG